MQFVLAEQSAVDLSWAHVTAWSMRLLAQYAVPRYHWQLGALARYGLNAGTVSSEAGQHEEHRRRG